MFNTVANNILIFAPVFTIWIDFTNLLKQLNYY